MIAYHPYLIIYAQMLNKTTRHLLLVMCSIAHVCHAKQPESCVNSLQTKTTFMYR